jgi:CP family cyanate transporter-like MFS transporter
MLPAGNSAAGLSRGRLLKLLFLLFLAGVALRMTILAMPPVIPLVHAAVPGSLLIARIGARRAVVLGMILAALAGGARGLAIEPELDLHEDCA